MRHIGWRHWPLGQVLLSCTLAGCGGGDSGPPVMALPAAPLVPLAPAAPAASAPSPYFAHAFVGAFGGTYGSSSSEDLIVAITESGWLFGVYGTGASSDFKVAGIVTSWYDMGQIAANRIDYRTGGIDWRWAPTPSQGVSIDLALDMAVPSMVGAISSAAGTRTITGGAIPGLNYRFDSPATLETIRGHWDLVTPSGDVLALDVDAAGAVTGTYGGCTIYGSELRPSTSGRNIYELIFRLRNGWFACNAFATSEGIYGFALAYASAAGGTQLVIGGENGWDPVAFTAAGKR